MLYTQITPIIPLLQNIEGFKQNASSGNDISLEFQSLLAHNNVTANPTWWDQIHLVGSVRRFSFCPGRPVETRGFSFNELRATVTVGGCDLVFAAELVFSGIFTSGLAAGNPTDLRVAPTLPKPGRTMGLPPTLHFKFTFLADPRNEAFSVSEHTFTIFFMGTVALSGLTAARLAPIFLAEACPISAS